MPKRLQFMPEFKARESDVRPALEWRECMGIEPTGDLSPGRPPILKTGAGTSRTHTPASRRRVGRILA